jgi:hypothetical protein
MRRACVVGVVVALVAAACHRQPKPVLEYGETVTYTSTANDPVPQAAPAPVGATAAAPATPPVDDAPVAAAAAPPEPADPASEGEWTTTVQTAPPPAEAPAASPPSEPSASPPAPRQWYKAKPW